MKHIISSRNEKLLSHVCFCSYKVINKKSVILNFLLLIFLLYSLTLGIFAMRFTILIHPHKPCSSDKFQNRVRAIPSPSWQFDL